MILGLLWMDKIEILIVFWVFEVRIASDDTRRFRMIYSYVVVQRCLSFWIVKHFNCLPTNGDVCFLYILFSKKISESWISISYINEILCVFSFYQAGYIQSDHKPTRQHNEESKTSAYLRFCPHSAFRNDKIFNHYLPNYCISIYFSMWWMTTW